MPQEPLHLERILEELDKINGWEELNQDFITKKFHFPDFNDALSFVNKIGVIAEAQGHHPKIILTYGAVRFEITTHDAGGLTQKDFDLAKLIDEVFDEISTV